MIFDDIEMLLVLSKAKSLSQAANQLYISRPALSQRIDNLEKKFGLKLFDRTSSGIELTNAGQYVIKFAENTADLERVLASELAAIGESFEATLNVGMSLADGVELLPSLVASFVETHENTRVHLDAGYEPELARKLHSGELDLAIMENWPVEHGLTSETLGYKKLVFMGPNKPPYNQIVFPLPVETLITLPMIIYEWNSGRHMVGNRHFRERYGLSLQSHNMIACFDTHEAMVNGVKAGLGWASLPDCIAAKYRGDPDIVRFKVKTPPMWYPVSLVWSSKHEMSDEARAFIQHIRDNIPEGYFSQELEAFLNS